MMPPDEKCYENVRWYSINQYQWIKKSGRREGSGHILYVDSLIL